jgi:hypothetical protein
MAVGTVASAPVAARSALLTALAVLLVALAAAVRSWRLGD